MIRQPTGQHDGNNTEIYVGDLVTLTIPRKIHRDKAVVFEVVERNGEFFLIFCKKYSGIGESELQDPTNYKQKLSNQVDIIVVGNIKRGIDADLFN